MQSPLRQQERPSTFQPKIARLYEELLAVEQPIETETAGFWREFFILKPDLSALKRILESLEPHELLECQHETRALFDNAIRTAQEAAGPADKHALDVSEKLGVR